MKKALIRIAPPFDDGIIDKLKAEFCRRCGSELEFDIVTDETLVGGFIAYVDGKVYDTSLKTGLDRMRKQIVES